MLVTMHQILLVSVCREHDDVRDADFVFYCCFRVDGVLTEGGKTQSECTYSEAPGENSGVY